MAGDTMSLVEKPSALHVRGGHLVTALGEIVGGYEG
jgi:hypothetical protein